MALRASSEASCVTEKADSGLPASRLSRSSRLRRRLRYCANLRTLRYSGDNGLPSGSTLISEILPAVLRRAS
jgi:hypothetical protein